MVKIIYCKYLIKLKHIIYVLILLFIAPKVHSQNTSASDKDSKKIEILNADVWEINEKIDKDLNRLLGNVVLKHKEVKMTCDSAYYFKKKNQVRAFSKVHIEQGDTLNLYTDYLLYDGELETAFV